MRLTNRVLLPAAILLALLSLQGCSSSRQPTETASSPVVPIQPAFSAGIPTVAEIAATIEASHGTSYAESDLLTYGKSYVTSFPYNLLNKYGNVCHYQGAWEPANPDPDDLAFGIYPFAIGGYDRDPVLYYHWSDPPADYNTIWFGLANWGEQRWDWRKCSDKGYLAYSSFDPYLSSGHLFVIIVAACNETCTFDYLQVGPPQVFPVVDAYPRISIPPAQITATAAASTTAVGIIVNYEWDWDGDGVFEEDTGGSQYSTLDVSALGVHELAVRVTTDYGIQATGSRTFEVIDEWAHSLGRDGSDEFKDAIAYSSEYVYAAGSTMSYGAGGQLLLVKYDYHGNYYWTRLWGGGSSETARSLSLIPGGDLIVAGNTHSFGAGKSDFLLQRWDSSGNLLWSRTWGGSNDEYAFGVQVAGNHIYVAGRTKSFGNGNDDVALLKYDHNGNLVWQRTWGGSSNDAATDLEMSYNTLNQSYTAHLGGYVNSFDPAWALNSILYLKFSADGDIISGYQWPCEASIQHVSLAVSGLGGTSTYLAGMIDEGSASDVLFLQFTPGPDPVAIKWGLPGNSDYARDLVKIGDNYVISGSATGHTDHGGALLLNLSASGGVQGAKVWDAADSSTFYSCRYLGGSGLLLSGYGLNAAGAFVPVSANLSAIDRDWEGMAQSEQTPSGITASPSGVVESVTDAIRDSGGGGNHDAFICGTAFP